ncbi:MAG: 6-phosphogluconate dehydrogenase [Bacteroidia bacterium]|nr:6-phosphogluconate dehydrogenase [Bacteroidia bacterium]
MDKVKRFLLRFLIFGSLISLLILAGYLSFARFATYSDGNRTGKVSKLSKKGVLWKTWEGSLNEGGHEGGASADKWLFSIYPGDNEIVEKIKEAQDKNQTVNLHYRERFFVVSFWGDTKYFIDDVNVVED